MDKKNVTIWLLAWTLVIPLVYLGPLSLARHAPGAVASVLAAVLVGLAAVGSLAGTPVLERASAAVARRAPYVLAGVILLYVAVSFDIARVHYAAFSPHLSQVGIFAQSCWTTLHGHVFANTNETVDGTLASHFGVHFSPTLLLLVPLYALWPSPLLLMLVQAVAVGLTIVPLYYLLRPHAGKAGAVVMASALLVFPVMAWAGSNDFHDTTIQPVLFLSALVALERRRWRWFAAASAAALGVREDGGLVVLMMGLYAGMRGFGWKRSSLIGGSGIVWLLVATFWVMPRFAVSELWINAAGFFSLHLSRWGDTPAAALSYVAGHPLEAIRSVFDRDRLHYVYRLLAPTMFLPALAGPAAVMGAPMLAINVLSGQDWMRRLVGYYAVLPALFAYLATAQTACRLPAAVPAARRGAVGLAAALVVLAAVSPALRITPPPPVTRPSPPAAETRALLESIPPGASVYSPLALYPHLANRLSAACRESLRKGARDPQIRGRYAWFVLWPAGDPPGTAPDAALAGILDRDPRFRRVEGHTPFIVYRRREGIPVRTGQIPGLMR